MRTLAGGAVLTILVSVTLSTIAAQSGLSQISQEALNRTEPSLLDLGIALIAGGIATYAKLRSDAVSTLAGSAIAVALVFLFIETQKRATNQFDIYNFASTQDCALTRRQSGRRERQTCGQNARWPPLACQFRI
mgnify:CR=1 FL=1